MCLCFVDIFVDNLSLSRFEYRIFIFSTFLLTFWIKKLLQNNFFFPLHCTTYCLDINSKLFVT